MKLVLEEKQGAVLRALNNGRQLLVDRISGAVICAGSEHLCSRETLTMLLAINAVTRCATACTGKSIVYVSTKKGREAFNRWDKLNPAQKAVLTTKTKDHRFGVVSH